MTGLSDAAIVAVGLETLRYWRPIVGDEWAARIAAAKMTRLHERRAS